MVFCGRKVATPRPRVRSVEGREVSLQRCQAFAHPERMEESVSQRILCRNVKCWRDGNMAQRWAASVLLEAQGHFHRIQAYSQLP